MDSVRPLYGPLAGGTQLTITGQFVRVATVTAVHFGPHKLYPDNIRLFYLIFIISSQETNYFSMHF